ncbi:hypothetical protein EV363DRAFT_1215119 [Boletus edulis]|nr:hypothetical protein EV363DRAFT_1215119 [Boletus edulis]
MVPIYTHRVLTDLQRGRRASRGSHCLFSMAFQGFIFQRHPSVRSGLPTHCCIPPASYYDIILAVIRHWSPRLPHEYISLIRWRRSLIPSFLSLITISSIFTFIIHITTLMVRLNSRFAFLLAFCLAVAARPATNGMMAERESTFRHARRFHRAGALKARQDDGQYHPGYPTTTYDDGQYHPGYPTTTYNNGQYTPQSNANDPPSSTYVDDGQYHPGYPTTTYNNGQYTPQTTSQPSTYDHCDHDGYNNRHGYSDRRWYDYCHRYRDRCWYDHCHEYGNRDRHHDRHRYNHGWCRQKRYDDGQYHPDPKFDDGRYHPGKKHERRLDDGKYHPDPKFDDGKYHPGKTHEKRYDDGQYHPDPKFDDGQYRPPSNYDDGQYHPGTNQKRYDGDQYNAPSNYDDGQYHPDRKFDDGKYHPGKKHESTSTMASTTPAPSSTTFSARSHEKRLDDGKYHPDPKFDDGQYHPGKKHERRSDGGKHGRSGKRRMGIFAA